MIKASYALPPPAPLSKPKSGKAKAQVKELSSTADDAGVSAPAPKPKTSKKAKSQTKEQPTMTEDARPSAPAPNPKPKAKAKPETKGPSPTREEAGPPKEAPKKVALAAFAAADEGLDDVLRIGESIEVFSDNGSQCYTISREGPYEWYCSCPSRKFAKKDDSGVKPDCKHITRLKEAYAETGEKPDGIVGAPKAIRNASGKSSVEASHADGEVVSFAGLTNSQLKELLRHNDQLLSGNKSVLVERVVDVYENGCLPRCPKCGIGRLKPAGISGTRFVCPGGYDDDAYVPCRYETANPTRPAFKIPDSTFSFGNAE